MCMCSGVLLSQKAEWDQVILEMWMDLEAGIQSEVRKKKTIILY